MLILPMSNKFIRSSHPVKCCYGAFDSNAKGRTFKPHVKYYFCGRRVCQYWHRSRCCDRPSRLSASALPPPRPPAAATSVCAAAAAAASVGATAAATAAAIDARVSAIAIDTGPSQAPASALLLSQPRPHLPRPSALGPWPS